MKAFESSADIEADPQSIWSILTDASGYTSWDSGVLRLDGRIGPNEKLAVVSEANPKRAFKLKVTTFTPPNSMTWTGGMPLGLFRGVRTYTLTPTSEARTHFAMREEYSGPLAGLIGKSIPDLGPSFRKFAEGLKVRAERGS